MATVYLQPGSGTGTGTEADPYFFSQLSTAETAAGSGGTILFTDGSYNNVGSGMNTDGVTYQSLNRHKAVITGTQLSISGSSSISVTFKNFKVQTNDRTDIWGTSTVVDGCFFDVGNHNYGIWFRSAIDKFTNNIYIHNNTSHGNSFGAIGDCNEYSSNTVFLKGLNGRSSGSVGNHSTNFNGAETVKNNIFFTDDTANNVVSLSWSQYGTNCCFHQFGSNNTSGGTDNVFGDPVFVDSANSDLRLRPTSPCIGAGTAS